MKSILVDKEPCYQKHNAANSLPVTHLAPRLPLRMGAVTTLFPFTGWLMTESGTVMRAGSFPCSSKQKTRPRSD